jgi:hypothetical protein
MGRMTPPTLRATSHVNGEAKDSTLPFDLDFEQVRLA